MSKTNNEIIDLLQKVLDPEQPESKEAMLYALKFRNDCIMECISELQKLAPHPLTVTSKNKHLVQSIPLCVKALENLIVPV